MRSKRPWLLYLLISSQAQRWGPAVAYQTRPASNSGGVGGRINGQPDLGGVAA